MTDDVAKVKKSRRKQITICVLAESSVPVSCVEGIGAIGYYVNPIRPDLSLSRRPFPIIGDHATTKQFPSTSAVIATLYEAHIIALVMDRTESNSLERVTFEKLLDTIKQDPLLARKAILYLGQPSNPETVRWMQFYGLTVCSSPLIVDYLDLIKEKIEVYYKD